MGSMSSISSGVVISSSAVVVSIVVVVASVVVVVVAAVVVVVGSVVVVVVASVVVVVSSSFGWSQFIKVSHQETQFAQCAFRIKANWYRQIVFCLYTKAWCFLGSGAVVTNCPKWMRFKVTGICSLDPLVWTGMEGSSTSKVLGSAGETWREYGSECVEPWSAPFASCHLKRNTLKQNHGSTDATCACANLFRLSVAECWVSTIWNNAFLAFCFGGGVVCLLFFFQFHSFNVKVPTRKNFVNWLCLFFFFFLNFSCSVSCRSYEVAWIRPLFRNWWFFFVFFFTNFLQHWKFLLVIFGHTQRVTDYLRPNTEQDHFLIGRFGHWSELTKQNEDICAHNILTRLCVNVVFHNP